MLLNLYILAVFATFTIFVAGGMLHTLNRDAARYDGEEKQKPESRKLKLEDQKLKAES
jgi:hypothetical protein